MAPDTKTTVVIAHGAWHKPIHFSTLISKLEAAGYEVSAPTTASVDGTVHEDSLSEDTTILKTAIETHTNRGKDVVLLMHSYAGIYGSEAVAEFHLDPQNSQPGKGRIVHLFYISAIIVPPGTSLISDECTQHILSPEAGLLHHLEPYHRFYEHVPLPVARQCIAQLMPQDASSFATPAKHRGWADHGVPVTYLLCKQDLALYYDPDLLRFAARIREVGTVEFEAVEMDTDHTPWLSREEEFMGVLWGILGKVEGGGKAGAKI